MLTKNNIVDFVPGKIERVIWYHSPLIVRGRGSECYPFPFAHEIKCIAGKRYLVQVVTHCNCCYIYTTTLFMPYSLSPDQLIAMRKIIGASLKKKRTAQNITRQQLVKASGLVYFTIRRIEDATGDYKIDNLMLYRQGLKSLTKK